MKTHRSLLLVPMLALACARAPEPQSPAPAPAPAPVATQAAWPPARIVPQPIAYPADFRRAIDAGTRTADGRPGARYWQQWAEYDVAVRVDPAAKRLDGMTRIVYQNRSPAALPQLWVELAQNVHAPGAPRSEEMEATEGLELTRVLLAGREIQPLTDAHDGQRIAGYIVNGTRMLIQPAEPLAPGASITLEFNYGFDIPQQGAGGRMGWDDDNLVYLAYFHPRMAVFDDVTGWMVDPFTGNAEFYHGFGNYTYSVDVPAGWVVIGTGAQTNRGETLSDRSLERLRRAEASDAIVSIIGANEFDGATRTSRNGRLVWRFEADTVRDIAVSITRESHWDAARTPVGDRDGDGQVDYARADAVWRATAPRWQHAARYTQHAIDFLSRHTATPYPWPHMTSVEAGGIIGGGMEYPQMTLIGDYNAAGDSALYNVIAHELAHMWVPMIVSTNERRYGWMDEGTTTYNENQARKEFFPEPTSENGDRAQYLGLAGTPLEGEMMRWTDFHYPGPAGVFASYMKPATVLASLRNLLGEETFTRAYLEFFDRWQYKHAYPYDLWNTFEDVSGRDLDWFWYSWYYTTWVLDQAVADVTAASDGSATIVVEDRGLVPMPARVRITRADGTTLVREVPVETWLGGATRATLAVPAGPAVTRVEIDADQSFPDKDRTNNTWTRG